MGGRRSPHRRKEDMSLKDRNAKYDNAKGREDMRSKTEVFDINVLRGGVPADVARGGIPKETGPTLNESRGGIPAPWPSFGDDPQPTRSICSALTKKGNLCQASPVTGTSLCVGHTKQGESRGN